LSGNGCLRWEKMPRMFFKCGTCGSEGRGFGLDVSADASALPLPSCGALG